LNSAECKENKNYQQPELANASEERYSSRRSLFVQSVLSDAKRAQKLEENNRTDSYKQSQAITKLRQTETMDNRLRKRAEERSKREQTRKN
jgi:hypothetical protein